VDGFYWFMEYFIIHHKLQGGLFEGKVKILLAVINFECMMWLVDPISRTHDCVP